MLLNPLRRNPPPRAGIPVAAGSFPAVGHLPALIPSMLRFIREQEARLGPLFWVNRGFGDHALMVLGEPAFELLANKVTRSRDGIEVLAPMMGESMILADGPAHRRMRGAVARTFSPKGLGGANAGRTMATIIEDRVARWEGTKRLKIVPEARELALDVIFAIVGVPVDENAEWRRRYDSFLLGFLNLPTGIAGSPRWRSQRARRWIDARMENIIERAAAASSADLVGGMVQGRDDEGRGLTHQELVDNLRLLLFAGHETTATVIAWMGYHLAADPDLWERLLAEVGPETPLPTTSADLDRFPFALGLFREALRLHSPVGLIGRKVAGELELQGKRIPEGTSVMVCVADLSRDPERYEDPDQVRPERWMKDRVRAGSLETVQFGAGPHFCLGYHLACLEGVQFMVAFASSLQRRRLRLARRSLPSSIEYPLARPSARAVLELERV